MHVYYSHHTLTMLSRCRPIPLGSYKFEFVANYKKKIKLLSYLSKTESYFLIWLLSHWQQLLSDCVSAFCLHLHIMREDAYVNNSTVNGARLWCLPCHAKRVCWCASVTDIHSSLDDACRPCVVDRTVRWPQTRWDESGCCLLEKSSYSLYTVYRVPGVRRNVLLEDEEVNSPDTSRIAGNRCSDRSTSR